MWTATRLANRAARQFELDDEAKTRLHRIFRNLVAKGVLLTELDEDDERGTLLFDDRSAAVALLLFPLAEMAMDVRGLRDIAGYCLSLSLGGKAPIVRAMQAVKAHRAVTLVISLRMDGKNFTRNSHFEIEGESPTGEAKAIFEDYRTAIGSPLSVTRIAASDLLKALAD